MSNPHEEEALGKAYDAKLTRRLLRYMWPYKWSVVFALLMTLAISPLEAVPPYLYHVAIDSYLLPGLNQQIHRDSALHWLLLIVLVFLGALLAGCLSQSLQLR